MRIRNLHLLFALLGVRLGSLKRANGSIREKPVVNIGLCLIFFFLFPIPFSEFCEASKIVAYLSDYCPLLYSIYYLVLIHNICNSLYTTHRVQFSNSTKVNLESVDIYEILLCLSNSGKKGMSQPPTRHAPKMRKKKKKRNIYPEKNKVQGALDFMLTLLVSGLRS
jgi:hypothetical protein